MPRTILASTLAIFSCIANAQTPVNLITFANPQPSPSPPGEFLETWNAGFNTVSLRSGIPSIRLNLPDGSAETANLVYFEPRSGYLSVDTDGDGDTEDVVDPTATAESISWRWYGKSENWTAALTLESGILAGRITSANARYGIKPDAGGLTLLGLINSEHWQLHPHDTNDGNAQALSENKKTETTPTDLDLAGTMPVTWDTTCSAPLEPTLRHIDVLIMYTDGVVSSNGQTVAGARAALQSAFDDATQSLRNTKIFSVKFNLRGIEPADTSDYDTTALGQALRNFGGWQDIGTDPYIVFPGNSYVRARRDAVEADIVALARVANDGLCGVSLIQHLIGGKTVYEREPGPGFEKFAYLVFNPNCNGDRLNLTHEIGHLLGMEHDPKNSTSVLTATRSCPWSHAHRRPSFDQTDPLRFRTIMSYWQTGGSTTGPGGCGSSAGCPLIDAYSSVGYEWNGSDILPVGTWPGAALIGVPVYPPPTTIRPAKADDTIVRLAKVVEVFRNRTDLIFLDTFQ